MVHDHGSQGTETKGQSQDAVGLTSILIQSSFQVKW